LPPLLTSPFFPYTTLFRSEAVALDLIVMLLLNRRREIAATLRDLLANRQVFDLDFHRDLAAALLRHLAVLVRLYCPRQPLLEHLDRKSTRLNSSHGSISYA